MTDTNKVISAPSFFQTALEKVGLRQKKDPLTVYGITIPSGEASSAGPLQQTVTPLLRVESPQELLEKSYRALTGKLFAPSKASARELQTHAILQRIAHNDLAELPSLLANFKNAHPEHFPQILQASLTLSSLLYRPLIQEVLSAVPSKNELDRKKVAKAGLTGVGVAGLLTAATLLYRNPGAFFRGDYEDGSTLEAQLAQLKAEKQKLEAQLKTATDDLSFSNREKDGIQDQLEQITAAEAKLEEQLQTLIADLSATSTQKSGIQDKLEQITAAKAKLEEQFLKQITGIQDQATQLTAERDQLRKELNKLTDELRDQKAGSQSQIADIAAKRQAIQNQLDQVSTQLSQCKAQVKLAQYKANKLERAQKQAEIEAGWKGQCGAQIIEQQRLTKALEAADQKVQTLEQAKAADLTAATAEQQRLHKSIGCS